MVSLLELGAAAAGAAGGGNRELCSALSGATFPGESVKLRLPQRFPRGPQVQDSTQASEGLLPCCQVARLFLKYRAVLQRPRPHPGDW
jgi:hypothetical protein